MKLNIFYLLLATLFFTACEQKEVSIFPLTSKTTLQALIVGDGKDEDGKDGEWKEDCFELVYPLSITMPDGSVLSGNKEDLWGDVKAWYETNPNSKEKPSLNYPVDILWKDEVAKTINNDTEMEIVKKYCGEEEKDCFELVYPVTWTMSDGASIAMNDSKDWDAIKVWYEANPDSEEKPSLNYPVDVIFENGTTQTVSDENEMESIKADCE